MPHHRATTRKREMRPCPHRTRRGLIQGANRLDLRVLSRSCATVHECLVQPFKAARSSQIIEHSLQQIGHSEGRTRIGQRQRAFAVRPMLCKAVSAQWRALSIAGAPSTTENRALLLAQSGAIRFRSNRSCPRTGSIMIGGRETREYGGSLSTFCQCRIIVLLLASGRCDLAHTEHAGV